jgi:hypothetical protein
VGNAGAGMSESVSILIPCSMRSAGSARLSKARSPKLTRRSLWSDDGSTDGSLEVLRRFDLGAGGLTRGLPIGAKNGTTPSKNTN